MLDTIHKELEKTKNKKQKQISIEIVTNGLGQNLRKPILYCLAGRAHFIKLDGIFKDDMLPWEKASVETKKKLLPEFIATKLQWM